MGITRSELTIRGKSVLVPAVTIGGKEVTSVGRWLRHATVKDEEWLEGESLSEPASFIHALQASGLPADIMSFSPGFDDSATVAEGRRESDNAAVIRTADYTAWWDGLPQVTRKNTRRAATKGIVIRPAAFDDELIAGIKKIYDESPVRQGRKFWHYGKDLATIKRENGTYLERSEFLGAYYAGELVGFMKWVYVGNVARIMQILCMTAHQDKRPIVALIAKAAEICHHRRIRYLVYGKFIYGNKTDSSIIEFKKRLGFERLDFPRYYVPLSWRGHLALQLGLHRGVAGLLPQVLISNALRIRARWLQQEA